MNRGNLDKDDSDARPLPGPNRPQKAQQYQFTQEEMRVMKECNRESFFQRCLPFGTILGASTYYGVNMGYLKPSARFGAAPKVIVAVIVGYFLGKFSYHTKCAEKLMQLPNSQIGEMLRQRRRGVYRESLEPGFGPGMSLAPFNNVNPSDTYSDLEPRNNIDIDTTRPQMDGLDEMQRPSLDSNPSYEEEMPPVQKNITSYEELRKRNREDYLQRRTGNYKESRPSAPQGPPPQQEDISGPSVQKNIYGDTWG